MTLDDVKHELAIAAAQWRFANCPEKDRELYRLLLDELIENRRPAFKRELRRAMERV